MKHVLIALASFAATAAVCGPIFQALKWQAEQPLPAKPAPATAPDPRIGPPTEKKVASPFKVLEPGLEFAELAGPIKSEFGDSKVRVLRIDPTQFDFRLLCSASANPPNPRTARQWCKLDGLVAAINASMTAKDGKTSIGLMQTRGYVNNAKLSGPWRALLGFDPRDRTARPVAIMNRDLKESKLDDFKKTYETVVQGGRLIPKGGRNFLYKDASQRWSAAAVGIDRSDRGRVVFLHVRSPYSMQDLVSVIISLKLNLDMLMLTGSGPEAQLFVSSQGCPGGKDLEFFGSYKTGLRPDDKNDQPPPIANVIGIVRKPAATGR